MRPAAARPAIRRSPGVSASRPENCSRRGRATMLYLVLGAFLVLAVGAALFRRLQRDLAVML
ncbi:hypothetical protein AB0L40_25270, partial [Patulibacter sp. NPDC049589]|uniref:hypothetical protein n=1 Tax=Patulibacter sp. NPDC049589 TaxID=3154731 RepID=UPI00344434F3